MIEIIVASKNSGKIREIKALLNLEFVRWLTYQDFKEWPVAEETGQNFEENAREKALTLARWSGKLALADDSGLEVDALEGEPGVRSARFAGEKATYAQNNEKLLELLKDVPYEERKARFRCVLVLAESSGKVHLTEGVVEGRISLEPAGQEGFGYDPIFIPNGFDKTLAEFSLEEKNKISHRGQALQKMRDELLKLRR